MTSPAPNVTVGWLVRTRTEAFNLGFEVLAGTSGFDRTILTPYVLKTGLALAGFDAYLQSGRVVVFGASEMGYLTSLSSAGRHESLARVFRHSIPCVLVTNALVVPDELPAEAELAGGRRPPPRAR